MSVIIPNFFNKTKFFFDYSHIVVSCEYNTTQLKINI